MPVFRTENLAQPRGLITPVSRPPWGRSLLRPIGLHAGMRGTTPRADCACEAPRTPSFFFVREKERRGRKKKPRGNHPAEGGPLSASRQPLCRCGLRSPAREIQTFSARVAIGTPANNHAAARSAFYQPRLAPASPHAPKSRATNSPGAPLHKENKETKGDALPLPVSPA